MSQQNQNIEECVRDSLEGYFRDLGGETPNVRHAGAPGRKAAAGSGDAAGRQQPVARGEWLGLNRNTLRKKLVDHQMLQGSTTN
jgi:Fis family transcriptional regulator